MWGLSQDLELMMEAGFDDPRFMILHYDEGMAAFLDDRGMNWFHVQKLVSFIGDERAHLERRCDIYIYIYIYIYV